MISDHDPTLPFSYFLKHRGVTDPCPKCNGLGVYHYSSGSTWRGGIGTCAFQWDVCCECWGTGDKHRKGYNIRELETQRKNWEENQCLEYLARRLGTGLNRIPLRILDLAKFCEKQANRRKIPEGESEFWWSHEWHMLGRILKKLVTNHDL